MSYYRSHKIQCNNKYKDTNSNNNNKKRFEFWSEFKFYHYTCVIVLAHQRAAESCRKHLSENHLIRLKNNANDIRANENIQEESSIDKYVAYIKETYCRSAPPLSSPTPSVRRPKAHVIPAVHAITATAKFCEQARFSGLAFDEADNSNYLLSHSA